MNLALFNWVDYAVLAILLLSVVAGLMRGFVKEIFGILAWIVAFIVARIFAVPLASFFMSSPKVTSTMASASEGDGHTLSLLGVGLSFLAIFIAVLIIGKIIGYLFSSALEVGGVSFINRFFGGVFGVIRGFLFVILLMFMAELTTIPSQNWWQDSYFVSAFRPTLVWLIDTMHPGIEAIKTKIENNLQTNPQEEE